MMKILIIEDNPANMKLVTNILELSGYPVLQAYNAETGISLAKAELPDLILMDIMLTGMDGLSASKILKNDESTRDIPIIAMTSMVMRSDDEKLKEAGCDMYISKPFSYKEFLEIVRSFSENPLKDR
ncbi:MAG: response regulator [Nitrospirota bacterium]|nr:response regulator [Nitrospirota bacterium]